MNRRDLLKTMGAAAASTFVAKGLQAQEAQPGDELMAVLVDTTLCVG